MVERASGGLAGQRGDQGADAFAPKAKPLVFGDGITVGGHEPEVIACHPVEQRRVAGQLRDQTLYFLVDLGERLIRHGCRIADLSR